MVSAKLVVGVVSVLLGVLLSGCFGSTSSPSETTPESSTNPALATVRGLVTDDELLPIPSAEVAVRGATLSTRTNERGAFELRNVPVGNQTIDAAKLGHLSQARFVDLSPGEVLEVNFQLATVPPTNATFHTVSQFTGYYECALGAVVWVSACSYPYTAAYWTLHANGVNLSQYGAQPDIQKNTFRYNFTVNKGAKQIVSEMQWKANSPAADTMQLILSCGDYDPVLDDCDPNYARVQGKSPLRVVWNVGFQLPGWVMARGYLPFSKPQVALDQKFEVWNSIFYGGTAPDGYTILPPS